MINNSIFIKKLFQPVDNSALVLFRIVFGMLLFLEAAGAVVTGWVKKTLVDPQFTFSFIGFDWLQPLPGISMYVYYWVMAVLGIMISLGMFYRLAMLTFTIMWTITYWMQTTHYNNHYYLLILICIFMFVLPAHRYNSYDARRNRVIKKISCPQWCIWVFIFQLLIVFTYAAKAKLYPGWIEGDFISIMMASKRSYPIIGGLLQNELLQKMIVWGGVFFDGLIVYFLLYRKTRIIGLALSVIFHLFNSIVFQIGIFPYLMIALCVFFFPGEEIRKVFFKSKPVFKPLMIVDNMLLSIRQKQVVFLLAIYFSIQIILPLRHHFIDGNVFWTDEGHLMSWRMMLRTKYGRADFRIVNPETKEEWKVNLQDHLTRGQRLKLPGQPAMIWKFAQHLSSHYHKKGIENVEVYVKTAIGLNGNERVPLIDPTVDLANVKWDHFHHKPWIYSYDF